MTLIVGVFARGRTLLGGDSGGFTQNGSNVLIMATPKVFRKGKSYLIGVAGDSRVSDLVRHAFDPPELSSGLTPEQTDAFMVNQFIVSLRKVLKDNGAVFPDKADGGDMMCGESVMIVATRVGLYYVAPGFSCSRHTSGSSGDVLSIGSGMEYGRAVALALSEADPRERIEKALEITSRIHSYCREPFHVFELNP